MLNMPLTSFKKVFNDRDDDEIIEFGSGEELMRSFAESDTNEDAHFVVSFGDDGMDFQAGDDVSLEYINEYLAKKRRRWLVENHFPVALRDTRPDIAAVIMAACPSNQNRDLWFTDIASDLAAALDYQGEGDTYWKTSAQRLEEIIAAMPQAEFSYFMAKRPKLTPRDEWRAKLAPSNPQARSLEIVAEATKKGPRRKLSTLRKLTGMTQQEISIFISSQKGPAGQVAAAKLEAQEDGEESPAAIAARATYVLLALATPEQREVAATIVNHLQERQR